MVIEPYLNFNGNCAEALAFYAQLLHGTVVYQMTFAEMPADENMPPLPPEAQSLIMHALLDVNGQRVMMSDSLPANPDASAELCAGAYQKPQGMWVSIAVDSAEEGARIFEGFAAEGTVTMPYAPTFWSKGFGMVVDRFATPWMVNVMEPNA